MVMRIVLCRPRPEATEEDYVALLAAFKNAIAGAPGLLGFHIGRRVEHPMRAEAPRDGKDGQYEFAVIYQFVSAAALRLYERRPAHEELRKRFAVVSDAVITGAYDT